MSTADDGNARAQRKADKAYAKASRTWFKKKRFVAPIGAVALLGAGLTAFYMTRVMILTFFGRQRWREGAHPHESPVSMTAPT